MKQKVIFVSSGQPTLNPRLVKEADALCDAGYDVTVLYSYWNAWGTAFDKKLIPSKKWHAVCIGGDPEDKWFIYILSKILHRVATKINSTFNGKVLIDIAIARSAFFLIREAKQHIADIYIAHNIGALPAVVNAAQIHNKPCGFDAEDFHRHETTDDNNNADVILKSKIEDKYFPHLSYFTASSPQIADAYTTIYPALKPTVLLNVFPKNNHLSKPSASVVLKLFWFSQTIGTTRGIESIVSALNLLNKTNFELHLLGNQSPGFETFINEITNSGINVYLHKPLPPDEIIAFASQFDVGLALENQIPYNRNICLTNKIFTYIDAGLAVIASDTLAQKSFMEDNSAIGRVYPNGNSSELANILLNFQENKDRLESCKKESLRLAQTKYNWENESLKFLDIVKQTLDR